VSSRAVVVLGVIGLIVGLGVIFAVFFGVQTAAVIFVKRKVAGSPEMSMVPQPLLRTSASEAPGKRFSYFGYGFELPWTDATEDVKESSVRIDSTSGKAVLLLDLTQGPPVPDLGAAVPTFLDMTGHNSYAFYDEVLQTTPDQLSVFMPRDKSVRAMDLLSLKFVLVPVAGPPSGIFTFAHGDSRGFQFGDPAVADKVFVEVFHQDQRAFEVVFFTGQDPEARLTQEEINRVITTLRRVDGKERSQEVQGSSPGE